MDWSIMTFFKKNEDLIPKNFKNVENITDGWFLPYNTGCVVNFNINTK
jgi:hypothetical protein